MKLHRSIGLLLFLPFADATSAAPEFRTDINPALRYYQAYLKTPQLGSADHDYLFVPEWRGKKLDERFGSLIGTYGGQFKFLRAAAHATVPCDWGIDMSEGPYTLMLGLAPAKAAAQTARLRVMWHLQNGRQADAGDDLLAAFVLGRNLTRDGTTISALVQFAIENIIGSIIAENFFQWQPDTLRQIADGLDASPARGTIAQSLAVEKTSFCDWLLRKIRQLQQENPGNDAKVLEKVREVFDLAAGSTEEGEDKGFPDRVLAAAGGKVDRLLALVQEMAPLYDKAAALEALPPAEFEPQIKQFMTFISTHPNPLVRKFFPFLEPCRTKEFAAQAKLAMVRAGIEYKLRGNAGLQSVTDPFGNGPFSLRRFVLDGQDRGFELKSDYHGRGFDEVLIFVEKDGPPFKTDWKDAGQPVPKRAPKK